MSRQLIGAVFCGAAAVLYAARHIGAATIVATKTGDLQEQYRLALQTGGTELRTLALLALALGVIYLAWGEYESHQRRG
ncbi:MAG: hypothetical protein QJR03_02770 [Sphaerobacter sp.]|nr:hypothetical protein [Sphaerobacter sp.]